MTITRYAGLKSYQKGNNMLRHFILIASASMCIIYCTNPAKVDTNNWPELSAQEKADITKLAAYYSTNRIDTITVCLPSSLVRTPYHFIGTVQFDSSFIDTDIITYPFLTFYNRRWYTNEFGPFSDSGLVFVKDWFSGPDYIYSYNKRVFKIDSMTIIASSDDTNKSEIVGYLTMIENHQFTVADTGLPAVFLLTNINGIHRYSHLDTTVIMLSSGNDNAIYEFRYYSGILEFSHKSQYPRLLVVPKTISDGKE